MARNLVICLDGTGAQPRARGDSNVIKVFGMLDLTDPTKQIAYYDPGVGTFSSSASWGPLARWLSRVGGLAFGNGLRQNLGEAYTWLMQEWDPGDRIFVFGFSRGAYTARALSGMLRTIGLLHAGSENLVPYAVSEFTKRSKDDRPRGQDGDAIPSGKTPHPRRASHPADRRVEGILGRNRRVLRELRPQSQRAEYRARRVPRRIRHGEGGGVPQVGYQMALYAQAGQRCARASCRVDR
ncbi:DUF2235 domain-containing protein [Cryobacterium breve]|uniref:DUF2235 domain-containing protein n=1 Tax=Cryobacterium breve TaxID=1259258 RepID=A0ABY7ND04_9MICO|nr:DUF2235 domain-containing protein [Cryobacterium breve]